MSKSMKSRSPEAEAVAKEVVGLLHRLGVVSVVREPGTAEVIAAGPSAEAAILGATPGSVTVVAARIGGVSIRVEALTALGTTIRELSPRQVEVAEALIDGLSNQEIGEKFGISEHTARRHVEEVLRRMRFPNRKVAADELGRRRLEGTFPGRRRDEVETPGDGIAQ